MHDSSQCPVCNGTPAPGSMTDAEFAAFLAHCREELAHLQSRFQQRIQGGGRWFYDLSKGTLIIGDRSFPITPIGTYSEAHQSWLWAWANEEFPDSAREAARGIQALYTRTGCKVFISPGIPASAADARDFVALAVHSLGAAGFFCAPAEAEAPALYLAVHEPAAPE